jgi:hypothetical protein
MAKAKKQPPATRPARSKKRETVPRETVPRETVSTEPAATEPATQPTAAELRRAKTPEIKPRGATVAADVAADAPAGAARPRGRPPVVLTVEQVKLIETLSLYRCTTAEISGALMAIGVEYSVRSLKRNYGTRIKEWRDAGKATLRRAQWQKALSGNPTMLIWMGKQILGQRDKNDTRLGGEGGGPVRTESVNPQAMVIGGKTVIF